MKSITLIALNAKYCHTSLSIRSIGIVCQEKGIPVFYLEHSINESYRDIIKSILRQGSDVYAFSCYLWNIELIEKLCIDLKQLKPKCHIMLGGPEVSYDPQEYPFADVIICGEGENAVTEYLLGIKSDRIIQGSPILFMDDLPFCYSDDDLIANKGRLIYYESSRGCPFSCSYCLSSIEKGVRYKSVSKVCEELKRFDNAKVELVKFVDRTFNANKKRAMEIWKFAAEKCQYTKFHFELSGELLDEETFSYLKTVPKGKFQFEIGVQSTYEPTLKAVDRKGNLNHLFENIRKLTEIGNIHIHTDLIVGMPLETYEIFQKSFCDLYSLKSDCIQIGFLKLLKGSKIRNEAEEYKYHYSSFAPYEIYDNEFITSEEVFRLEQIAETVERYYNSHAFEKSIAYVIDKFETPFHFYERLSEKFDQRGAVSQKNLYAVFYDFFIENFGESKIFSEWLKFDWLKQTKGSTLPDYLGKNEFLQPVLFQLLEENQFKHDYIPEISHLKNKEIVKKCFIAKFNFEKEYIFLFYQENVFDITKEYNNLNERNL